MTEPLATTEAEDPLALAGDLRAVLGSSVVTAMTVSFGTRREGPAPAGPA